MTDPIEPFPPAFSQSGDNFAIVGNLHLLDSINVPTFMGLLSKTVTVGIQDYPKDALEAETSIGSGRDMISYKLISVGFLETAQGRNLFSAYCESLKNIMAKYPSLKTHQFISDLLDWDIHVHLKINTAKNGVIVTTGFESDLTQLDNTARAFKKPMPENEKLVMNSEDDDNERYLFLAERLSIDAKNVHFECTDFDADSDEEMEVMHKVTLVRADFGNKFMRTSHSISEHMKKICTALGFEQNLLYKK